MVRARTPRHAWIDVGLRLLGERGPDAVRVEVLARELGVTKGGFYGYFADRPALLTEVLDEWERRSTTAVIERAEHEGGDPVTRARRAAALTFADDLVPIDLAVREWARRDDGVAARLKRVDNQRMDYLRTTFRDRFPDPADLEARCLLAFAGAISSSLIVAEHPGETRAQVLERAASLVLGRRTLRP
ncbi:TetR/AcrR family transcriptional regulator [Actinomycetospora termitidis]|uniref:Helix-turn-helix domain-containing protein n=1 Tax=Actinomycetospora termitidis TaxID=3053470 RepID=A0ABT7ME38_9PSEU|nr:TetR/AcrR family transcriptional regulator [Actinomycetospora sp. Odt1-22]MDL5158929.1 helix-turn-helix domain-containing protein [Actinomycetospora sp. Odt1-22]